HPDCGVGRSGPAHSYGLSHVKTWRAESRQGPDFARQAGSDALRRSARRSTRLDRAIIVANERLPLRMETDRQRFRLLSLDVNCCSLDGVLVLQLSLGTFGSPERSVGRYRPQFLERSRRPTLERLQERLGIRVTENADNEVGVIAHHAGRLQL